jgi:CheY-like chemotaxis protein
MQALDQWAQQQLPQYMQDSQWQPSVLLPDLASPGGLQQLSELRQEAQRLPTDVLVVLVRGCCC